MIVAKADQQHSNETTTYGQYRQWGQDQYQIYRVTDEPAVNLATYDFSVVMD
jgi:hypothetical protein